MWINKHDKIDLNARRQDYVIQASIASTKGFPETLAKNPADSTSSTAAAHYTDAACSLHIYGIWCVLDTCENQMSSTYYVQSPLCTELYAQATMQCATGSPCCQEAQGSSSSAACPCTAVAVVLPELSILDLLLVCVVAVITRKVHSLFAKSSLPVSARSSQT